MYSVYFYQKSTKLSLIDKFCSTGNVLNIKYSGYHHALLSFDNPFMLHYVSYNFFADKSISHINQAKVWENKFSVEYLQGLSMSILPVNITFSWYISWNLE